MSNKKRIAIIGGGASGIFCALLLKEKLNNTEITIYEGQNKIGKKILQTGNGKCNLSNTNITTNNYNTEKINNILKQFNYQDLINILNRWGLMTRIDEEGRIYPYSEKATTVLDIFLNKINDLKVKVVCDCYINNINYINNKFTFKDKNNNNYESDYLVICTGGSSSINYNYNTNILVNKLNHRVSMLTPSLCALKTKESTKSLSGLRVKCKASINVDNDIHETIGEVLFKDDGLSGIAIFILSQFYQKNKKCIVSLDLYPDKTVKELNKELINNNSLENNLMGYFPKMVNIDIIKRCNNQNNIGEVIKNYSFNIIDTYGFNNSQVTKGGIILSEINLDNCKSLKNDKLYIAGEALDVDGSCGGFNLHFAFASANSIAKDLIEVIGE